MDTKDKDKNNIEEQDKGFTVQDKRRVGKEDPVDAEPTPPRPEQETSSAADNGSAHVHDDSSKDAGERGYPPLTFSAFILSLSTSALIYLGQAPDPVSGKTIIDREGARQTIDLIAILKQKTEGNLTPEEASLIESALYDLRMLFIKTNK
jgi:hypothetical protein